MLIPLLESLGFGSIGSSRAVAQRLEGGRSNYVWKIAGGPPSVLKIFGRSGENPLFENNPTYEALALKALAGTRLAPDYIASGSYQDYSWIQYSFVEGSAWKSGPSVVAHMLQKLHDRTVPEGLPQGPNGSAALARQTQDILNCCTSSDASTLWELPVAETVRERAHLAFVHRDPVPGNIVVHGAETRLIDWQCPAVGDPAEDLAVFLSPAMQSVYRGYPLSQAEVDVFLGAYGNRDTVRRYIALKPHFAKRMAAYCLWQSERGNEAYRQAYQLEMQKLKSLIQQ